MVGFTVSSQLCIMPTYPFFALFVVKDTLRQGRSVFVPDPLCNRLVGCNFSLAEDSLELVCAKSLAGAPGFDVLASNSGSDFCVYNVFIRPDIFYDFLCLGLNVLRNGWKFAKRRGPVS